MTDSPGAEAPDRRRLHRRLVPAAAVVLVVAATFALPHLSLGQSGKAPAAKTERAAALSVSVAKPETLTWPVEVTASGWLKPWHEAIIGSELGGQRIDSVAVDVGSTVKKGDVLAKLSTDSIQTKIREQLAAVTSAQAALQKATSDATRATKLQGSGAVSQQQINNYLIAEREAQAAVDQAQAALAASRLDLSHTKIVAVDDGVISSRTAALGDVVSTGQELFRLIRQDRIEWQAEVPVKYVGKLRPGVKAVIPTPFGDVQGQIRLVAPTVSSTNGRVIVYVALPRDDTRPAPKPGILVTGSFILGQTPALTVPNSAVVLRDGFSYLYTLDSGTPATVTRRRVDIGRRQGDRVEVLSGLDPSQQVVQSGGAFLSDGSVVRVVPSKTSAPAVAGAVAPVEAQEAQK